MPAPLQWVGETVYPIHSPSSCRAAAHTHSTLYYAWSRIIIIIHISNFFFPLHKISSADLSKAKKKLLFFSSFFCWLFIVRASAMALKSKCTIQSWSKRRNCSQANLAELQRALPSYYYSFLVPSGLFYFNLLYARTPMPCGAKWMQMKCKRKMEYGRRVFRMNGRGESWNGNEKK